MSRSGINVERLVAVAQPFLQQLQQEDDSTREKLREYLAPNRDNYEILFYLLDAGLKLPVADWVEIMGYGELRQEDEMPYMMNYCARTYKIEELEKVLPPDEYAVFFRAHQVALAFKGNSEDAKKLLTEFNESLRGIDPNEHNNLLHYLASGAGCGDGIFDAVRNNGDHDSFFFLMKCGVGPDVKQLGRALHCGNFDYLERLKLIKFARENYTEQDLERERVSRAEYNSFITAELPLILEEALCAKDKRVATNLLARDIKCRAIFVAKAEADKQLADFYYECKTDAELIKEKKAGFDPTKRTTKQPASSAAIVAAFAAGNNPRDEKDESQSSSRS